MPPTKRKEDDEDAPLPLSDLRERVPSTTYKWLQEVESQSSLEETGDEGFFSKEEEEKWARVEEWCSSTTSVDGIGGYKDSPEVGNSSEDLRVSYILSYAGGGHGDDLWAASRYVANRLANADTCRELLSPLCKGRVDDKQHPLMGLSFLELGAGAGLPAWTAVWRGAKVVCSDQAIPDRIRCLAESAERNCRAMASCSSEAVLRNARKAQVCPYDWGTSITEISNSLAVATGDDADKAFDVIVAADCIYMPEFHQVLLKSIDLLLSDTGVALLPFALHGNVQDDKVWGVVQLAEQTGFQVEQLESLQLTPQAYGMDSKRALVHTLRLTRIPV